LSVIKRDIIDEIKDIKRKYQTTKGEGDNRFNDSVDVAFDDSHLRSRDFEDLTKEQLMSMLAKA
jgi:hypothetical protein